MHQLWKSPLLLGDLTLRDDGSIVGTGPNGILAADDRGNQLWYATYERLAGRPIRCAGGVVFSLYERHEDSIVVCLDDAGEERWRHTETDWFVARHGVQAWHDEVILIGYTIDGPRSRAALDARTGTVRRRDESERHFNLIHPTARWWVAQLDDGGDGLERIDPATGESTALTSIAHIGLEIGDDVVFLETSGFESPSSFIAIDLESGRELWRHRGGLNLYPGLAADRVVFATETDDGQRPIVCDRRTGKVLWTGDPLPPLRPDNYFAFHVNEHAIIVYGSFDYVAVHGYAGPTPVHIFNEPIASQKHCILDGTRYIQATRDGLHCWSVP